MVAHPIPIQRPPITADGGTAEVGRTEDAVRRALDASQPTQRARRAGTQLPPRH